MWGIGQLGAAWDLQSIVVAGIRPFDIAGALGDNLAAMDLPAISGAPAFVFTQRWLRRDSVACHGTKSRQRWW